MVHHGLSCDSLSLVGLLPGKEKAFLPPAEQQSSNLLPVGDAEVPSLSVAELTLRGKAGERVFLAFAVHCI